MSRETDESDAVFHELEKVDGVTWELTLDQNLDGWYYSYRIEGKSVEGTSTLMAALPSSTHTRKPALGIAAPESLLHLSVYPKSRSNTLRRNGMIW